MGSPNDELSLENYNDYMEELREEWIVAGRSGAQAELADLRAEKEALKERLEQIRDREFLEPSEYIAIYGEPSMTAGELARAILEPFKEEATGHE